MLQAAEAIEAVMISSWSRTSPQRSTSAVTIEIGLASLLFDPSDISMGGSIVRPRTFAFFSPSGQATAALGTKLSTFPTK